MFKLIQLVQTHLDGLLSTVEVKIAFIVDSYITSVRVKSNILVYYIGVFCHISQVTFENMQTGSTTQTDIPRKY